MKLPTFILFLLALIACPLTVLVTGCAGTTPSSSTSAIGMPSSTALGAITLTTTAGVSLALDFGIKQDSTRNRIGGYIYTDATLTMQVVNGAVLTPDQYQAYLVANGIKGDAQYTQFVPTAVSLYKSLVYPRIAGNPNAAAVEAYLLAFAQGLQNGAAAYAPQTVLPNAASSTTWNSGGLIYSIPETQLALDDQGMEFTR